jgi:sugar/nucleoside kinase (ribokinase family)
MNQKRFGATVTALRKRAGLTQAALAETLNVSDKAISKWENGLGYPEITLLPRLAAAFGVTVDYLLSGQRRGITLAGSIVVDSVKTVDRFPKVGMLAYVDSVVRGIGGCAPNVAIDLCRIDPSLPTSVLGCVGDDEHGRFVISQLQKHNIDSAGIRVTDRVPTSFSDVMSLPTGERTFFHARGANTLFCPEDINIPSLSCQILNIGYIFLLDSFDKSDPEYGTVMAAFLKQVQEAGIKTSIDVVSDSACDFGAKVTPALKYTDYVIINEIECCLIWDLDPRKPDGSLNIPVIREAMEKTMACGVGEKVIVHSKEAGFCLDRSGRFTATASLQVPPERIRGSVGAGDAFCAGCLYGIYHGYSDLQMLEFASADAACNLFSENAVDGMRSKEEILALMAELPRRKDVL